MTRTTRDIPPTHARSRRWVRLALGLLLGPQIGCSREFYRNWANQDATEGIFEKSRDPRWRLDLYSAEPPALSRFANPYDPDFPPAPPDDPTSEFLSPVPQNPKFRLMVPLEGTGYIQMLERFRRDRPARPPRRTDPRTGTPAKPETPGEPPLDEASPFRPDGAGDDATGDGVMDRELSPNSGTPPQALTPTRGANPPSAAPASSSASQARRPSPSKDPGVLLAAYQETNIPPPAGPAQEEVTPEEAAARARQNTRPIQPPPAVENDPFPGVQVTPETDRGAGLASTPEGEALERFLTAPVPFGRREEILAAGLPEGSSPYVVNPRDALELALVNSRLYQFRMEGLLLTALPVTLQRFAFEPQFYAGLSPSTGVGGNGLAGVLGSVGPTIPPGGGVNQYVYRTREAPGGSLSQLQLSTVAGFGKLFNSGLRLAGGFANTTIFSFAGNSPRQPTVQSILPLTLTQPFLRGGGRAVTLEPLTQAERNLLYEVRNFARFRQEFFVNILTNVGQGIATASISGGINPTDTSIGYLNLVRQLQQIENDQKNVAAFDRVLQVYLGLSEGAGSNISSLDVDQIDSNLQQSRSALLQDTIAYRNALDQFKQQLGLPPDVPMIPDYSVVGGFSDTFAAIDALVPKQRADLDRLIDELPDLEDILIDGRSVFEVVRQDTERTELLEDLLLAAERIALENRLDLMSQRAQLYDTWRQIRIAHNALRGIFNLTVTNQVFTPASTANPFAFLDQAKQFSLVVNGELPLVRVNERNNFRLALVNYERQRRNLMASEDTIKFQVRQGVRNVIQNYKLYEIQKRNFVATLRAADLSLQNLLGPAQAGGGGGGGGGQGGTQTQVYATQQRGILTSENSLVQFWVNYETFRLALFRDLGTAPYDEWEAFYEFFPAATSYGRPPGGHEGPAAPAADLGLGAGPGFGGWPAPPPVAAP